MVAEYRGGRGLSKRERRLRARRRKRFDDQAREHQDAPGSLLADPQYHMAAACGWDVQRPELRRQDPPPSDWYDPADVGLLRSTNCPAWRWWTTLTVEAQDELYGLSLAGRGADEDGTSYVELTTRLTEHVDPRSVQDWGR